MVEGDAGDAVPGHLVWGGIFVMCCMCIVSACGLLIAVAVGSDRRATAWRTTISELCLGCAGCRIFLRWGRCRAGSASLFAVHRSEVFVFTTVCISSSPNFYKAVASSKL